MLELSTSPKKFDPNFQYTIEEFEELNDWLKTNDLIINNLPISHFERADDGHLLPIPLTPTQQEVAVVEIGSQLSNWNTTRLHHGRVTLHGGYKFGQDSIRAPNIAFTLPRITTTILEVHKDEVWNIKWSHDGAYLASASKDKCAIIWRRGVSVLCSSESTEMKLMVMFIKVTS